MMVTERSLSGRSGRALPVRDRRRGDRIDTDFAALRSVANGTKRRVAFGSATVAFGADMHCGGTPTASVVTAESPGGISPPGAPRTVHDPLESHGSRCSAVAMT